MKGPAPWRRTLEYLDRGRLIFQDKVKIFSINYHDQHPNSEGLRRFIFWHLSQIQYKNPKVQCVQFKNLSHTPHITVFTADDKQGINKVYMNCYKRNENEILDWCTKIVGKSEEQLAKESLVNPANFTCDNNYARYCICQIPGQVSCPQFKELPKFMRGKYYKSEELEEHRKLKSDDQELKEYWQNE